MDNYELENDARIMVGDLMSRFAQAEIIMNNIIAAHYTVKSDSAKLNEFIVDILQESKITLDSKVTLVFKILDIHKDWEVLSLSKTDFKRFIRLRNIIAHSSLIYPRKEGNNYKIADVLILNSGKRKYSLADTYRDAMDLTTKIMLELSHSTLIRDDKRFYEPDDEGFFTIS